MIAVMINVILVLAGSLLGIAFRSRISDRFSGAITAAMGLCVLGIGISGALGGEDTLCIILCMAAGTLLGEALRLEERMEGLGEALRRRFSGGGGNSRFVEGFVNASVLFCVGAMAINGSMQAGMNHQYDILISKSVIDGITSVTFAAAMGVGTALSALPLFLYEGGLTVIFALVGQGMDPLVVSGMSAVGGTIIVGIGLNMLGLPKERLRVGNMLPAMFLPILYIPLSAWLKSLF